MALKKRSGAETGFTDKDGKPILVHAYVADEAGAVYLINAYSQAVPTADGVAVELDRLMKDGPVRVLSAQETLELNAKAGKAQQPEKKPRTLRTRKPAAEAAPEPAAAPKPEAAREDRETEGLSKEDIKASLAVIIGTIPDKMLADELRRRGYVFSAVKPVILNI